MYLSHEATIADAEWIAHVRSVRSESEPGVRLVIIEYLKGEGPTLIEFPPRPENPLPLRELTGEWIEDGNVFSQFDPVTSRAPLTAENFYDHRASQFWADGALNFSSTDCRIWPRFNPDGSEYLVFGPLDYNLGFEQIDVPDDAWLLFVREVLATGEAEAPFPIPIADYLGSLEAVIRIQAVLDGDDFSFSETVLIGDQPTYLNTLFALPETQLRDSAQCVARRGDGQNARLDWVYFIEVPEARASNQREGVFCSRIETDALFDVERTVEIRTYGRLAQNRIQVLDVRDGFIDLGELSGRHRDIIDPEDQRTVRVEDLSALLALED